MALEVQQHRTSSSSSTPFAQGGVSSSSSSSSLVPALARLRRAIPTNPNLISPTLSSSAIELGSQGRIHLRSEMSRNGRNPKLDLKLNLSPPRRGANAQTTLVSPNRSMSSSPTSPHSSCVSTEADPGQGLQYSNSPEATSMLLVGCPRCLMYVMLSEDDPKCPKCKSTVLLDFLHDNNTNKTNNNNSSSKKTRKS